MPLEGEAVSHEAFDVIEYDAGTPTRLTDCSAMLCVVKFSDDGVAVIEGAVPIVIVTAIGKLPLMVNVPLYEPGLRPAGFTVTVIVDGVVPLKKLVVNQEAFDAIENACGAPVLETTTVCERGVARPSVIENANEDGVAVSAGALATVSVTGTVSVPPIVSAPL